MRSKHIKSSKERYLVVCFLKKKKTRCVACCRLRRAVRRYIPIRLQLRLVKKKKRMLLKKQPQRARRTHTSTFERIIYIPCRADYSLNSFFPRTVTQFPQRRSQLPPLAPSSRGWPNSGRQPLSYSAPPPFLFFYFLFLRLRPFCGPGNNIRMCSGLC